MAVDKGIGNVDYLRCNEEEQDNRFGNSRITLWIKCISPGEKDNGEKSTKGPSKPISMSADDPTLGDTFSKVQISTYQIPQE